MGHYVNPADVEFNAPCSGRAMNLSGSGFCRDTDSSWVGSGVRISRFGRSRPTGRVRGVEDEPAIGDTPEFFASYPVDGWSQEFSSRRRRFRTEERPPERLFSSARTTYRCAGAVSPAWTEAFQVQHPEWVSQALRAGNRVSGGRRNGHAFVNSQRCWC